MEHQRMAQKCFVWGFSYVCTSIISMPCYPYDAAVACKKAFSMPILPQVVTKTWFRVRPPNLLPLAMMTRLGNLLSWSQVGG